jgi:toxin CcdB
MVGKFQKRYLFKERNTREIFPYLVDIQADVLNDLPTRLVVPLVLSSVLKKTIPILTPSFKILNTEVRMVTPQLVGVPLQLLGSRIFSIKELRAEIIAALDLLITGFLLVTVLENMIFKISVVCLDIMSASRIKKDSPLANVGYAVGINPTAQSHNQGGES